MIFKDPKLKKCAIDLLFDLKNNTTIKGLYHKIDGCSLSTVDFFVHFEETSSSSKKYIYHTLPLVRGHGEIKIEPS